jgi:hypothetical protein
MQEIQFKINDKVYTSKALSGLTLAEYNKIFSIISETGDEIDKKVKLLHILTDIPMELCESIDDISIAKIDFNTILSEEIKCKRISKDYTIKNVNYKVQNLNKIKLGRFVDLDYFLTSPNNDTDKIQKVVALMLLNDDYDLDDITMLSKQLEGFKISTILSIFNFFTTYREGIVKEYTNLFASDPKEDEDIVVLAPHQFAEEPDYDEEEEVEEEGWGWQGVIFSLANKNINEIEAIEEKPLILVLNFLSYLKYENDKEIAAMKQQNTLT